MSPPLGRVLSLPRLSRVTAPQSASGDFIDSVQPTVLSAIGEMAFDVFGIIIRILNIPDRLVWLRIIENQVVDWAIAHRVIVGPVFLWGLVFLVKDSNSWREHTAFTAFVSGLLAKSVIDLIKKLFKNVFHA
jgi:hypothetical protein